jgi:hypothetical protein
VSALGHRILCRSRIADLDPAVREIAMPTTLRGSLLGTMPIARPNQAGNAAPRAIADRGQRAALEYADEVDSPAVRGSVLISIWFDPVDVSKPFPEASVCFGRQDVP